MTWACKRVLTKAEMRELAIGWRKATEAAFAKRAALARPSPSPRQLTQREANAVYSLVLHELVREGGKAVTGDARAVLESALNKLNYMQCARDGRGRPVQARTPKPKPVDPNSAGWTADDNEAYRTEIERRFRERTPPRQADEVDPATRVLRSEMRAWSSQTLGKLPPETDHEWLRAHARWIKAMIARVEKELG